MDAEESKVSAWLQSLYEPKGTVLHAANIVQSAVFNGSSAVTDIYRHGTAGMLSEYVISGINIAEDFFVGNYLGGIDVVNAKIAQAFNAIADMLKDPNIDGIPIHATQEREVTDVTVSKNVVIETDASFRKEVVDNAVPQLRTWSITGHLMANPRLSIADRMLVIKPSMLLQKQILQYYADSRRPVLYKTHDNIFHKVLISHFESGYNTNYLNAIDVNITLVEFATLEVSSEQSDVQLMDKVAA